MPNVYTLFENYTGPTDYNDGYCDRVLRRVAQTFTPAESHDLGRVALRVHYDSGEKPDDVTVGIWATSAGKPVGPALTEVTVDTDSWTDVSPGEIVNFDFETPVAVVAETMYAIVVGGTGADFQVMLRMNNGAGPPHYERGERKFSTNEGVGWFDGPDTELEFYEYGVAWSDNITIAECTLNGTQTTASNNADNRTGNSFQAGEESAFLTEANLWLRHGGSPGVLTCYIWECDANYEPIGDPIATSDPVSGDVIDPDTYELIPFTFDGTVEIVAGGKYGWAVGMTLGQTSFGISSDGYTPGVLITSTDNGGTWAGNTGWDITFVLYGVAGGGGGGGNIPTDVTLFESWGF